jgi:hypothetical protein
MEKRIIIIVTSKEETNKTKEVFEKKYESPNCHEELKAISNFDFRYYTSTEEAEPFFSEAFSIITMLETTIIGNFWCPDFKHNGAELLIKYPNLADVMFFSSHTETFHPIGAPSWKRKIFREYINFNSKFCTISGHFVSDIDDFWYAVWKSLFQRIKNM